MYETEHAKRNIPTDLGKTKGQDVVTNALHNLDHFSEGTDYEHFNWGDYELEKEPHKSGPQWKFVGSFYYALVVLTLIGYGHSTPKTTLGKNYYNWYVCFINPLLLISNSPMTNNK